MKIPVWEAVIIIGHINLISWKKEDIKKLILDIYSANNIYKKNPAPCMVFDSFSHLFRYRVNICLLWENVECSPLLVTNQTNKQITSLLPMSNNFLQEFITVVVAYIIYL